LFSLGASALVGVVVAVLRSRGGSSSPVSLAQAAKDNAINNAKISVISFFIVLVLLSLIFISL
jgi:hypothetical protein